MPEQKNKPAILSNLGMLGVAEDNCEAGPERIYNVEAVDKKLSEAVDKKNAVIYLGFFNGTSDGDDSAWQTTLNAQGASMAWALFNDSTLKTGYTIRDAEDRDWRYVEDVGPEVASVTITWGGSPPATISTPGDTLQLSASVLPSGANSQVTWSVSNTSVATISSSGLLTAVGNGSVTVTATSKRSPAVSGTLQVTVSNQIAPPTPAITITLPPQPASVTAGSISGSLNVVANSNVPSTLSYQWYSNVTNSNSNGTAVPGANSASFTIPTTLTAGTYYYYVRVSGTAGEDVVTSSVATVTVTQGAVGNVMQDLDGNTYATIQVGTLLWTTTNYKYAGNPAVGVFHNGTHDTSATPGNAEPFPGAGRLYTWAEANNNKPAGWELPSEAQWTALQTASQTGGATGNNGLKSTTLWPTANGMDTLGFNALPAGYRGTGNFQYIQPNTDSRAGFWASAQDRRVSIMNGTSSTLNPAAGTGYLMSVRYVKPIS